MGKSIFEEMGGRYEKQGDYLIPCLPYQPKKKRLSVFGGSGTCGI